MKGKVLVVDDSRTMRSILVRIVSELGFETCQASNGHDALEVFKREASTLCAVLTDWNMPSMSGYQFLIAVREDPSFSGIPIVMVTSETHIDQISAALAAGADEYIMKPLTAEIVGERLKMMGVIS